MDNLLFYHASYYFFSGSENTGSGFSIKPNVQKSETTCQTRQRSILDGRHEQIAAHCAA